MREWTTLPPWHPELPTTACSRWRPARSGPLFRQAKRELQRVVESGRYGPGETLPSESVIAAALGVSIGTLRKAVDELVHEHVLVRRQGKGTFVALHNDDRFLFQFFHVEPRDEFPVADDLREREYPQVECVGFTRGRADEAEAATLRIKPGDPVVRIANRLSLAGRPVVHDRLVVAAQTFRGLNEKRFLERPSTIYNLYQTDHGITVLRARECARAGRPIGRPRASWAWRWAAGAGGAPDRIDLRRQARGVPHLHHQHGQPRLRELAGQALRLRPARAGRRSSVAARTRPCASRDGPRRHTARPRRAGSPCNWRPRPARSRWWRPGPATD